MKSQQDGERLEDWVAETNESIAARLEGVKTAQAQTRLTLGAMAVISVMMLIASYNAYLSYDYHWIVKRNCLKSITGEVPVTKGELEEEPKLANVIDEQHDSALVKTVKGRVNTLTDHAMKEWASSRTVMISLLGIRVSVDDSAVLGTTVLFVLSVWLFLVARRENHTTGFLLRDTDSPRPEGGPRPSGGREPEAHSNGERWLIYHTIISNSLFVTFDRMPNVDLLTGRNSLEAAAAPAGRGRLKEWGLKITRGFFFWFPAFVALGVFALDRWSYFRPDPFCFGCPQEGDSEFFRRSLLTFVLCYPLLLICCWKSSQLASHTEDVLREYGKNLLGDLKRQERPSKS